jgi:DNA gyrase subunit A
METSYTENTPFINIEDEMKSSYLDYSMSVIIGRALPDFRDGLKPVHRRVLYAMHDLNNYHDKPYKKSARVVGDVIGKYHPHGDTAVYDAIVRLAQDFSMRYPLVQGQGNFGSIDGDSAAAMRYTEVRLNKVAKEFLEDLEKETVDFTPNYDDTLKEPEVLPTKIPNFLINGSNGIAVGMATSVPPHNISEVLNALVQLAENKELTVSELMNYIPGPDFPTKGIIFGREGIISAYNTGKGIIKVRAKAEIETDSKEREKIIVSELPFQVNKARLVEKIAELVKDKKIDGISDLRDESNRVGIRIVVEIKKGFQANVILNSLFKYTAMQSTFGIILLGIDGKRPKILNLKEYLELFINFRKDLTIKRISFELKKAEARAHILEGLKIAVENLDSVVELIKKANNPNEAKTKLIENYKLSEIQAQAILDLRLQRLTGMERNKIIKEYEELIKTIEEYKSILASDDKILNIVKNEFEELKKSYGDARRTLIEINNEELNAEDLINQEDVFVTITHTGYIKRIGIETFKAQRRGGKGVRSQELKEDDAISDVFIASTLDYVLCFSDKGKCYWLKVYNIPSSSKLAKGKPIVNLVNINQDEKIVALLAVKEFSEEKSVFFVSEKGIVKKTSLMNFSKPRSNGILAVSTDSGDVIKSVTILSKEDYVLLSTRDGKSIFFKEADVSKTGRQARGVRGIRLNNDDIIVGVDIITDLEDKKYSIMTVFEKGYGKKTQISEFRVQGRSGKGIKAGKVGEKGGKIIKVLKVKEDDELMLVSSSGQTIRIQLSKLRIMGRATQGVKLMNLNNNEKIVAVARVLKEENINKEEENILDDE